ncbi:MAG: GNAT family N-acetyltransferase [Acidimicrobiia bacterium]|nr:GNAT family N-acetyltransferase [Acidimicrobiia bacterium]
MQSAAIVDPTEFLRRTEKLLSDEARHNLICGVVRTLTRSADAFPEYRLFTVSDGGEALAAAMITAPYNLVVADSDSDDALGELAAAVRRDGVRVPGVMGNKPTIGRFVEAWERLTGGVASLQMRQGVWALEEVTPVPSVPGGPRVAKPADHSLVMRWSQDFHAEALTDDPAGSSGAESHLQRVVTRRLSGKTSELYWLWEVDGTPVSLTGHGNPTGRGIRIGPVYTPPEFRRNGYASALVAAESRWLLDSGYEFCFLYTDLGNPTSNAIYERIGYRQVAEAEVYGLSP